MDLKNVHLRIGHPPADVAHYILMCDDGNAKAAIAAMPQPHLYSRSWEASGTGASLLLT
jgi:hypothetical protein